MLLEILFLDYCPLAAFDFAQAAARGKNYWLLSLFAKAFGRVRDRNGILFITDVNASLVLVNAPEKSHPAAPSSHPPSQREGPLCIWYLPKGGNSRSFYVAFGNKKIQWIARP